MKLSLSLLDKDGYITLNKSIMRYLGIDAAILFGELFSEYIYYSNNDMLTEDGFFFSKAENIEANTTLSAYKQREALKVLKEKKFVDVDLRGVPAKNYFSINLEAVDEFLNSDVKKFNNLILNAPRDEKISQPDVKNFDIPYNNTEKERLNNINSLEDKKENKQIIKRGSTLTGLQALEVLRSRLDPEVYETLKDFIQMRKTIKKPITAYGLRLLVDKLFTLTTEPKAQIEILNRSILNCWQDIFDPNERKTQQPQRYQQRAPEPKEEEDALTRVRKRLEAEEAARKAEEEKSESGLLSEE